jgi:UDP-N-acetylmuramoyl-L-alanyl-D-glutamate--2,6-diaminopimelate ligase
MSYSVEDDSADVYCANYDIQPEGTVFDLVTPMGTRTISLKLPGRFNLSNAIAAATAGLASGVDVDNVVKGLESVMSVPGRLERLQTEQPFAVYVDYAHTPDAIERLCSSAREFCEGRLLLLFGCGGDRDQGKRAMMGAAAASADYAIVTTDNPRNEDPEKIIEDIKLGLNECNYEVITDRREAIAAILKMARPGDIVLLAGKGAESYQEINGKRYPFNDAEEARKILAELSNDARPPVEEN